MRPMTALSASDPLAQNELILAYAANEILGERSSAVVCQQTSPIARLNVGVEAPLLSEIFLARVR